MEGRATRLFWLVYLLLCFGSGVILILFVTRPYGNNKPVPSKNHIRQPFSTDILNEHRGIPKIIHQIWNDDVIPAVFHDNIRGLVAHNKHPNWTYYFWTMESGKQLIRDKFPRLVIRYSQADNLLKADILRLAVIYQYGGAYFDLDTVSVKPLDPFVESHECSLVTDPPEHVFNTYQSAPSLMITNSAILCKPFNSFILYVINQIGKQSAICRDAVSCTGPRFISKQYERLRGTSQLTDLPGIEDFPFFEDMVAPDAVLGMNERCKEPLTDLKYEWSREICRTWISRGREGRNISEMAFTYHTWFHSYYRSNKDKLRSGPKQRIQELVKNVRFYGSHGDMNNL